MSPLVEIGLTDQPKSGGAMAPWAPPGTKPLLSKSQGGGAKLVKSINVEEGINENSLQMVKNVNKEGRKILKR